MKKGDGTNYWMRIRKEKKTKRGEKAKKKSGNKNMGK